MNTNELFYNAQLSEAAYADFWDKESGQILTDEDDVEDALIASGFSTTQAAEFVTHWRVVHHQPNSSIGSL
ncbi:hypothetical protein QWY82_09850 [Simiduia curdlanivorans]|uniref:Nif11 domain-containing protein n=1 Tax=Simiduia curdlanivorans TaxID=1492769 RepID=A0ABV8V8I5_9GAMM|nr:hypothetical protein [Simiduia curdlanivorans]MDN3639111.1 hypothetical protein [Simiduia curdlanivorans]